MRVVPVVPVVPVVAGAGAGAGARAGAWLCAGAGLVSELEPEVEGEVDGVTTRTGAGLFTTTGEAGSLLVLSPGMLISEGMLNTVDGCEAAVCSGWLLEFIR